MSSGETPLNPAPQLGYRRELDGLRSVAVLSVVFYHFQLGPLNGGFVGVDIFFVLSGFFIGGILWRELVTTGRVDYLNFLYRRIRRLAATYFLVVLTSAVFAYFILLPFDFRSFGKEAISSTFYLSNVIFYRDSGYFDTGVESKVLLHTWSLSVEEQFYIFLPLAMILLARVRHVIPAVFAVIFLISLVSSIAVTHIDQPAAFYLFPFRAWELLAGVLIAVIGYNRGFSWSIHPALSWAGIGLISGAILFTPAGDLFPGALAVIPVLGTALLILNGRHENPVNAVLSHPVPVFFGLISYALYLWHWPVMSLSAYRADGEQGLLERVILIALSILLAWLTWRFVETPVRRGDFRKPAVLSGAVIASTLSVGIGGLAYFTEGLPGRLPASVMAHVKASSDFLQDFSRCYTPGEGALAGVELCPIGPEGPPRVLIWGDSHVRAYKEGLEQAAWEADVPGLIIWRAGCPPLFGIGKDESAATRLENAACLTANRRIEAGLDAFDGIETLLLVGRWGYYANGGGTGLDVENKVRLFPSDGSPVEGSDNATLFNNALVHTLDKMSARIGGVFVLRQPPEIANYGSNIMARKIAHGHLTRPEDITALTTIGRPAAERREAIAAAALDNLPQSIGVIDTWPEFCDATQCSAMHEGVSNYFDNNHVTNFAARRIRGLFAPIFDVAKDARE